MEKYSSKDAAHRFFDHLVENQGDQVWVVGIRVANKIAERGLSWLGVFQEFGLWGSSRCRSGARIRRHNKWEIGESQQELAYLYNLLDWLPMDRGQDRCLISKADPVYLDER
jgi:hypothetical protein